MGSDGLVELDQECWVAFAKYNLLLATAFSVFAVLSRTMAPDNRLLLVQNGAFAVPKTITAITTGHRQNCERSLIVIIVTVYRINRTQSCGRSRNDSQ